MESPTASGLAQKVHRTLFPGSRNLLKRGAPLLKSSPLLPGSRMLSPSIQGSRQGGSASPSSPPPRGFGPLYPHITNSLESSHKKDGFRLFVFWAMKGHTPDFINGLQRKKAPKIAPRDDSSRLFVLWGTGGRSPLAVGMTGRRSLPVC